MTEPFISLADVPRPPRLDEYFGLWAVEGFRFMAGFDRVRTMDLVSHVRSADRPVAKSRMMFTELSADDIAKAASYKESGGNGYAEAPITGAGGMKLAVIPICGVIMKQVGSLDDGTSSVMVRRDIRHAADDDSIGGIMLLVDSPGGSVSGTADLAAEVSAAAAKKPVYAFVEDLCASAAYWTASGATKIFANTATALVGSIGTYACLYDMSAAAAMQGVKAKLYATGAVKGAGTPGTEITPEQDQYFQGIVDQTQEHFTAAIAANRNIPLAKVKELATGAVYFAGEAQKNGLIDGIRTFDQALAMLGGAASKNKGQSSGTKAAGSAGTSATAAAPEAPVNAETPPTEAPKNDSTEAALAPVTTTTPPQEDAMSDPNDKKAASLKELKASLPTSTADFREKCLEEGLSLQDAAIRHATEQSAALEDVKAKSKRVGTNAIATGKANAEGSEDAAAQLRAIADEKRKGGMARSQAWAAACRENPALRDAYVEQYNAAGSRSEKARLRY